MWPRFRDVALSLWRVLAKVPSLESRMAQALAAEKAGQISSALKLYEDILQDHPDHTPAYRCLASLHAQQEQYSEAIRILKDAIKHVEHSSEILVELGNLYCRQGQHQEAERCFGEAESVGPGSLAAYLGHARCLHEQGRDARAVQMLKEVISRFPQSLEARECLGHIYLDKGDTVSAIALFEQALDHFPNCASIHSNLSFALKRAGRPDEAMRHLQLATHCGDATSSAWLGLAQTLESLHRTEEAIQAYQNGLALSASAHGYNKLGLLYLDTQQYQDAEDCFFLAINLDPLLASAFNNLGRLYREQNRLDDAIKSFRAAVEIKPKFSEARINLGIVLQLQLRFPEAVEVFKLAVEHEPECIRAFVKLGFVFREMGDINQSLFYYDRALEIDPDDVVALCHKGFTLQDKGAFDAAFTLYEKVLAEHPDFTVARWYRAYARLLLHDFDKGWPDYESRYTLEWVDIPDYGQPRWKGEPISGKTLLVCGEQGLGDQIMFSSCYPDLMSASGKYFLACDQRLAKLFQRSFPQATVIGAVSPEDKNELAKLGEIDLQVSSGSLPLYFRRDISHFPSRMSYLEADSSRIEYWKERLDKIGPHPKIGISWRGGVFGTRTGLRSIPLPNWKSILEIRNLTFINLQYGQVAEEIEEVSQLYGVQIVNWTEGIADLDEMAALICALDMVVSVCNTTIHLGGALGIPVWVLTPATPEWRYGQLGNTMPWYPSVKLYRQKVSGEWPGVLDQVAKDLVTRFQITPEGAR